MENDDLKYKITLHIFTSTKTVFEQLLSSDLYKITNLNPPVNFLEFLNLTTKFDVLLVEDSNKGNFKLNNNRYAGGHRVPPVAMRK